MNRIGADTVHEGEGREEGWKRSVVKWKIIQRINHGRLFARDDNEREDWFKRRRPEDDQDRVA